MSFNTFTLQLTQYISDNHPDRIQDKQFIQERGQAALQTFVECSRQGMTVGESLRAADDVLYRGLHFSPYRMIEEEVERLSGHLPLSRQGLHALVMTILDKSRPVLEKAYTPETADTFQGTYDYELTCTKIRRIINRHLYDHGLQ